jgi:hypothetical protein
MRVTRASTIGVCALAAGLALNGAVRASPVVYTVRTIASGDLGTMSFTDARLTISLTGDTRRVQTTTVNGAVVYTNSQGVARLSITELDGTTIRATFNSREIFVRYDTKLGLVGFASAIGLAYPIIVGCHDPFVCSDIGTTDGYTVYSHYDGIATELADVAANPDHAWSASDDTLSLPTTLTDSTLLTGHPRSCAVNFAPDASCPAAPSVPLHTDKGDLYLSDPGNSYDEYGPAAIFTVTVLHSEKEAESCSGC